MNNIVYLTLEKRINKYLKRGFHVKAAVDAAIKDTVRVTRVLA